MIEICKEQRTREWFKARAGKVTGTSLVSALGTKKVQTTLSYRLLADRMTEIETADLNVPAMRRGREYEAVALKAAEKETGIKFQSTGFLQSDISKDFGLSPDGIHEESKIIVGGIEIKCPGSKKHLEYVLNKSIPKEYVDQVYAPFLASDDIKFWYFMSYDDRVYEQPVFIIKAVRADYESIEEDRDYLLEFLAELKKTHLGLTF